MSREYDGPWKEHDASGMHDITEQRVIDLICEHVAAGYTIENDRNEHGIFHHIVVDKRGRRLLWLSRPWKPWK